MRKYWRSFLCASLRMLLSKAFHSTKLSMNAFNRTILTVFTIMSVLSKRTQAEISAARELHTSAAIVAWIVVANRAFAWRSQVPSGALALPSVVKNLAVVSANVDVVLQVVMFVQLFFACPPIPTRIRQTCQRTALRYPKAIVSIPKENTKVWIDSKLSAFLSTNLKISLGLWLIFKVCRHPVNPWPPGNSLIRTTGVCGEPPRWSQTEFTVLLFPRVFRPSHVGWSPLMARVSLILSDALQCEWLRLKSKATWTVNSCPVFMGASSSLSSMVCKPQENWNCSSPLCKKRAV